MRHVTRYNSTMIKSFAGKTTESLFSLGSAKKVPDHVAKRVVRKLDTIDSAYRVDDLRVPLGNRLHTMDKSDCGRFVTFAAGELGLATRKWDKTATVRFVSERYTGAGLDGIHMAGTKKPGSRLGLVLATYLTGLLIGGLYVGMISPARTVIQAGHRGGANVFQLTRLSTERETPVSVCSFLCSDEADLDGFLHATLSSMVTSASVEVAC